MKKALLTLMCLAAMMVAGTSLKAQEVTIILNPGWTWISYPRADTLDIDTALGTFTPMEGDMIKTQYGFSNYHDGYWNGSVQHFYPGMGYMYYSTRYVPTTLVFGGSTSQPQVFVTTSEPMLVTAISAMGGGEVTTNDGNYVSIIVRGICWGVNPDPTINDNYLEVEGGIGSFTASMTSLNIGTTYYVRAYAVTANDTYYGEQKTFTTRNGIPILTTTDVTNIGSGWANCGGNISDDGGLTITARGVCWSISPNPTVACAHTTNGNGTGSYSSSVAVLSESTTYYVRAYATNSFTTTYGNEICFITAAAAEGVINALFSVSADQQVLFSQGNLQFQASTNTWRFAENQYDYIGSDNSNISSTYTGWIDLFGWGTSGWNSGNTFYHPWDSNHSNGRLYGPYGQYDLTGLYANADWGVYNSISNGGNTPNQWRTLTQSEWDYVFNVRNTSSGIRYANANVNNVIGIILLPDDWDASYYTLNGGDSSNNTITFEQWQTLEQYGAVFLPAAGYRSGTYVLDVGFRGYYWSASCNGDEKAYYLQNNSYGWHYRWGGRSVRLVADFEN